MSWTKLRRMHGVSRTERLNNHPKVGKFYHLPVMMGFQLQLDTLSKDWRHIINIFRGALIKHNKVGIAQRRYKIGKEVVRVEQQRYVEFHRNCVIEHFVFGSNYCYVLSFERISKTKNQVIQHFHSFQRLNKIFALAELSVVQHFYLKKGFIAAGKVFLKRVQTDMVTYVFIMDEIDNF